MASLGQVWGEFAGGLYLAVENVCDACAFAAGEPCHDKGVGGLDERGDGERAAGIVGVAAGYKNFAVGIQRKNLVVLEDDETFLNGFAGDLAVFVAADVLGDAYIGGGTMAMSRPTLMDARMASSLSAIT